MKTAANAPVNTVTILTASDPGQDEARQAWNLAADQRPAAIARPASAQDVVDAVGQAAMTPWAARQMYLNFADTSRDPASFWDPQAYSRLRPVKAAVDPEDRIQSNHPIPPATTHWPRPTPERTTMPSHTTTTGADYLPRRLSDAVGSARYSARAATARPSCCTPSPHQEHYNKCSIRPAYDNLVLKEMTARVVRVVSA